MEQRALCQYRTSHRQMEHHTRCQYRTSRSTRVGPYLIQPLKDRESSPRQRDLLRTLPREIKGQCSTLCTRNEGISI
eukprot:1014240-Rhodomonas_salina.1